MRILHISADAAKLNKALRWHDLMVDHESNLDDGCTTARLSLYQAVILDADIDSQMNLLGAIRALSGKQCSVIVYQLAPTVAHKVAWLNSGADDALVMPVSFDELFARVNACVRRHAGLAISTLQVGPIEIDLLAHRVTVGDSPLHLCPGEYKMLEIMALNKGHCVSHNLFLDQLYNGDAGAEKKIVEVYICKLRRKFRQVGADVIETVWGRGYKLTEKVERSYFRAEHPRRKSA